MRTICFELTMPNVGSWNGKWSGAERKYYVIERMSDKAAANLLKGEDRASWYYNFGDGWGASVSASIIDGVEARKRRKMSAGFCGYNWMIISIKTHGKIIA